MLKKSQWLRPLLPAPTSSIPAPLKLSAPTSLMQNANTDATLVCHANKPFDQCLWTTPYGKTYSFPSKHSR